MSRPQNAPLPHGFADAVREARVEVMKRRDRSDKHVPLKVLQDDVVADVTAMVESGVLRIPPLDGLILRELERLDDREAAGADDIVEALAFSRESILGEQDPWLDRLARTEDPDNKTTPTRTRWRFVTEEDLRAMATRRRKGALAAMQAAEAFTDEVEQTIRRMREQGVTFVGDLRAE